MENNKVTAENIPEDISRERQLALRMLLKAQADITCFKKGSSKFYKVKFDNGAFKGYDVVDFNHKNLSPVKVLALFEALGIQKYVRGMVNTFLEEHY